MMMSPLWSDLLHELDPYVPGEQLSATQLGVERLIKLNTNENPYPPSPKVQATLANYDTNQLRRYPAPESDELKQTLAQRFDLTINQVFVGNGSDEVLAHAFQAFFCRGNRQIVYPQISYSFYPVYAKLYQLQSLSIPLDEQWQIQATDYTRDDVQQAAGIIITNPNAPTGRYLPLSAIETIVQANGNKVVIIDEAYIDFGGQSAASLIDRYDNLLVIQTFSKSRSLAGIRLGYALGNSQLIDGLVRVKNSFNSYPIDSLSNACALASLADEAYFQQTCQQIIDQREWLSNALDQLGFEVIPSLTNFVFAKVPTGQHAQHIYQTLKNQGILVRYFATAGISDYLRISIGTAEENQRLIHQLSK